MKHYLPVVALSSVFTLGLFGCGGSDNAPGTNIPQPLPTPLDYQSLLNETVGEVIPGVVLHIASPQKHILLSAGVSDTETHTPMQVDAQMPVGSAGKKATALLTLMLYEDGMLNIDDTIDTWLPADLVSRIEYGSDITLRQLLMHTSGVHDYLAPDTADAWFDAIMDDPTSLKTDSYALAFSLDKPADFVPGTQFNYSNSGYLLVGLILDSVLGEHHSSALRQRVLIPLGMNNSYYNGVEKELGTIISGYFNLNGEILNTKLAYENIGVADAPLISTAEDLTRLIRAVASDNSPISASIRDLMIGDSNLTALGDDAFYGMGMMKDASFEKPIYHHGGDEPGYSSTNIYIPYKDTSITIFINCGVAADCIQKQDALIQTVLSNELQP
ncbi:MAG: beta-lactamase family protein [Alteromonadaceae bacterium]|nr:beta-lactamase family protein [Alteromonadaceae bacterium]